MTAHEQALEALSKATSALWDSIVTTAAARNELERIRAQRGAAPDFIMDAATGFRKSEAAMIESLTAVVDAQAKVLGFTSPLSHN